MRLYW